jgi:hypothetical protein
MDGEWASKSKKKKTFGKWETNVLKSSIKNTN